MLFKNTEVISPQTLEALERLQADEKLSNFFLVRGTALASQIGHRFSIDLDFFILQPFDTERLADLLTEQYHFQISSVAQNTLLGHIEGIKVDFITHAYPLVRPLVQKENLRLASLLDIGAMKLNGIAHSGQRLKDFIDIFCLLELICLQCMLDGYETKYPKSNVMIALKGLTYFEDLDLGMDAPILNREIPLGNIKERLLMAVNNPTRIFPRATTGRP